VTKSGGGTLALSGINTYSGNTNITAGTLAAASSDALGDGSSTNKLTISGATLLATGTVTSPATRGVFIYGPGATFDSNGNTLSIAGNIDGFGALTKIGAGTLLLSGSNTYTAVTTVSAGTLAYGASNVTADAGQIVVSGATAALDLGTDHGDTIRTLVLDGGGTITGSGTSALTVNAATFDVRSGTIGAPLLGTGSLNKSTAGVVTMTVTSGYTGGTTVAAGTLIAPRLSNGTLAVNAGLAQISQKGTSNDPTGTTVVPAVTVAAGATLDLTNNDMVVDYTGATPFATIRSLIISGYNGGPWNGTGITSSTAAAIAAGASPNKTAIGYAEASTFGTTSFDGITVDATAILLRYTYGGDANLDGSVDTTDFNILAANFSLTGTVWSQADFNNDGAVDTTDFNILASNFSLTLPGAAGRAGATPGALGALVPEPLTGCTLSLIAAGALLARRRKR
jgi:autotransporter-associated beta strand protein